VFRPGSALARRAGAATLHGGFVAEVFRVGIAADAFDSQGGVADLDPQHPQDTGRPSGHQPRAFCSVAWDCGRRSRELQRAVRVDDRAAVREFYVGDGVLDQAIEARHRAAGIDEIVAAAGWGRPGSFFGAIAGHGLTTGFVGSARWPS